VHSEICSTKMNFQEPCLRMRWSLILSVFRRLVCVWDDNSYYVFPGALFAYKMITHIMYFQARCLRMRWCARCWASCLSRTWSTSCPTCCSASETTVSTSARYVLTRSSLFSNQTICIFQIDCFVNFALNTPVKAVFIQRYNWGIAKRWCHCL